MGFWEFVECCFAVMHLSLSTLLLAVFSMGLDGIVGLVSVT